MSPELRHPREPEHSPSAEDEFFAELEPLDDSIDQLHDALKCLTTRQRFVIECRYGMRAGAPLTQREIAEMMGIAQQSVHDHEHAAIEALSKHLLSKR